MASVDVPVALLGYGTVGVGRRTGCWPRTPTTSSARPGTGSASCRRSSATSGRSGGSRPTRSVLTTDFAAIRDDPSIAARRRGDGRPRARPATTCSSCSAPASRSCRRTSSSSRAAAPSSSRPRREAGVQLRFEASVCAAIPVIKVLRESLVVTNVHRILGIVNGTTNFMLTRDGGRARLRRAPSPKRSGSASRRPTRPRTSPARTRPRRWRSSPRSPSARASTLADVDYEGIEAITPVHVAAARELEMAVRLVGSATLIDGTRRRPRRPGARRPPPPARRRRGSLQRGHAPGRRDPRDHARGPRGRRAWRPPPRSSPTWSSVIGTTGTGFLQNDAAWRELEPLPAGRAPLAVLRPPRGRRPRRACSRTWPSGSPPTASRSPGSSSSSQDGGAALHVVTHEAPGRAGRGRARRHRRRCPESCDAADGAARDLRPRRPRPRLDIGETPAMTDDPYARPSDPAKRRSAALTDGPERAGARAMLKATGFTDEDLARPLVGVATSWIETMPCNLNQRAARRARQGAASARQAARRSSSTRSPSPTASRWAPRGCAPRSSRAR